MNDKVKMLSERAKKYGAPEEESLCLAIARVCCEQCALCRIHNGGCNDIWYHREWIDYTEFTCAEFVELIKR